MTPRPINLLTVGSSEFLVSPPPLFKQALLMRGSCLLELNLDGCAGFGDAAVRMVCRACPGLLELSLLGCLTVRDSCLRGGGGTVARFPVLSGVRASRWLLAWSCLPAWVVSSD